MLEFDSKPVRIMATYNQGSLHPVVLFPFLTTPDYSSRLSVCDYCESPRVFLPLMYAFPCDIRLFLCLTE